MSGWDGRTKGSLLGYKIFIFFIKTCGVGAAYSLLRIVSYYYYRFAAAKSKRALFHFYTEGLRFSANQAKQLIRSNFFLFGQTLIDRVAFLTGKGGVFDHTFENEQYLVDIKNDGKGGVLLSGHLGNWETAGNLLRGRITPTINIVMLDAEVEKIKDFMNQSTGGSRFNIIAIKDDLSHIIKIRNALKNNEFVAIHADRYMEGMKYIDLDFLGKKARFPLGPFIIASKFNAPVTFVFAVKSQNYHYHLSATKPIEEFMEPEAIAKSYVAELEEKVRSYPDQWFNHFNYFVN
jgi:predicted LPLAT superfamily acyltransferase